jgi:hypothetical protein
MRKYKTPSNYKQLYEPLSSITTVQPEDLEYLDISQIFNTKKTNKMKKADFKNEVTPTATTYFKFENADDCIIIDSCTPVEKNNNGKMELNFHVTSETDDIFILPSHYNLNKRLKTLCAIDYDFSKGALITYLGEEKHPEDKLKTIKNYSVKTK